MRAACVRRSAFVCTSVALAVLASQAWAFPYTVAPGDSLTTLAERFYGRVEAEKILVSVNHLEQSGPLVAGMRLEIPAVGHHRITKGETWASIAESSFADPRRAEALALLNGTLPWVPPRPGVEVILPYPLRYVVAEGEDLQSISYRFLGKRDDGLLIDRFNGLRGTLPNPGDSLLIPIASLRLTDAGRDAARIGAATTRAEDGGDARDAQTRAEQELPAVEGQIRRGEWIGAIARGVSLSGDDTLTDEQNARLYRALLEAYVALGEAGLAAGACAEWRRAAPEATLDPIDVSPKVLRACGAASASPTIRSPQAPSPTSTPSASRP